MRESGRIRIRFGLGSLSLIALLIAGVVASCSNPFSSDEVEPVPGLFDGQWLGMTWDSSGHIEVFEASVRSLGRHPGERRVEWTIRSGTDVGTTEYELNHGYNDREVCSPEILGVRRQLSLWPGQNATGFVPTRTYEEPVWLSMVRTSHAP